MCLLICSLLQLQIDNNQTADVIEVVLLQAHQTHGRDWCERRTTWRTALDICIQEKKTTLIDSWVRYDLDYIFRLLFRL